MQCFLTDRTFFTLIYLQILFYFLRYLFIHEGHRHRRSEQQAPHGEPDAGLHPRTLGSQPEPKADAQPLSHPGAPIMYNIYLSFILLSGADLLKPLESSREGHCMCHKCKTP